MKTKPYFASRTTRYALVAALLSTFTTFYVAQPTTAFAQGTAFTYQGRLQNNGSPASGSYDLTFGLFNASNSGSQVGNTLTNSATGVTNGLFNVTLDFGAGVFTGDARWLEIAARTNGAALFTTLAPRQQLLPTPYAIMANSASNLLGTLPTAQLSGTIRATNLTGTISLAQLPAAVVTNNSTSITLSGIFSGNGAGLTGVPGSVSWQNVTGTSQQAQPNTGYLANNAAQVTITLLASPNLGDIVRVSGVGAGGWKIAQNAGQVIQAKALGTTVTNWNNLTNWTETSAPITNWFGIASSADGTKLVAVSGKFYNGGIWTSTNSGATWTRTSAPSTNWCAITSSADGTKLAAGTYQSGWVWTSTNSGLTWTQTSLPMGGLDGIASSADGTMLAAVCYYNGIYTSTNSGATWTPTSAPTSTGWESIASSADGTKLVAGPYQGPIYTSTNSGGTWIQHNVGLGGGSSDIWSAFASSADGTKLVAASTFTGGEFYTSPDSGATWTLSGWQLGNQLGDPRSVACSADGSKLALVESDNGNSYHADGIWISTNFGSTWNLTGAPSTNGWTCVASSADGTKLVAAGSSQVGIWTAQAALLTTTTPGTAGYLTGGQNSAIELQYIGNGQFMPLSYVGTISAY